MLLAVLANKKHWLKLLGIQWREYSGEKRACYERTVEKYFSLGIRTNGWIKCKWKKKLLLLEVLSWKSLCGQVSVMFSPSSFCDKEWSSYTGIVLRGGWTWRLRQSFWSCVEYSGTVTESTMPKLQSICQCSKFVTGINMKTGIPVL